MSHKPHMVFMTDRETHRRLAAGEPFENFPEKWVDLQKFEDDLAEFGKKFMAGKATLNDFVCWYESIPPAMHPRLYEGPGGEIFKPENIAILKSLHRFLYGKATTPEESLEASCLRLIQRLGIRIDVVRVASSWANILHRVKSGGTLSQDSLIVHDEHLAGVSRVSRETEHLSLVLAERLTISGREDLGFFTKMKCIFRKDSDIRPDKLLVDLQIDTLRRLLLTHWLELSTSSQGIGLADFTYQAIVEFCCSLQNARSDKEFNIDSVRNAVRRPPLQLIRRPSTVTSSFVNTVEKSVSLVRNGSRLTVPFQ